jgi:hypothetical protein
MGHRRKQNREHYLTGAKLESVGGDLHDRNRPQAATVSYQNGANRSVRRDIARQIRKARGLKRMSLSYFVPDPVNEPHKGAS